MPTTTPEDLMKDRIVGSIMGIFIGDALGVGVHWQYDLDKLEAERGFVTDYLDPLPGTYHSGTPDAPGRGALKAGQLEQQGVIDQLLLESLAEFGALHQDDFLRRFQDVILDDPTMDGTRQGGRYGWTDKSIVDIYQCRIVHERPWSDCAPPRSDTPDAIVRAGLLAALYYQTPMEMAVQVRRHARYATGDSSVQSHAVAFASMVAAVLQGVPLDERLTTFLYQQPGRALPFTSLLSTEVGSSPAYGVYSEPDALLWFGAIARGVKEFAAALVPAHRAVQLYGQFCAHFASVPSAYYCAARFAEAGFEPAVLCSVNGGGQNTMRTSLVGALLGARWGLSGIPQRFLDGLEDADHLLALAERVAEVAVKRVSTDNSTNDTWYWPDEAEVNFTIGETTHQPTTTTSLVVPSVTSSSSSRLSLMWGSVLTLVALFFLTVLRRSARNRYQRL